MTREEQLVFCKKCTNRKMDMQQGLLCGLTGEKADFSGECPDFNLDPSVKEEPIDPDEPIEAQEVVTQIPTQVFERLRMEQNFPMALVAGIVVGLIGSILWGAITVATGYQIGYMAIAIGAGVGFAMRKAGKGIDKIFGIAGAIIAILSCLIGNFLSIIGFIANEEGLGYFETLTLFDYSYLIPLMTETFSFIDLVFYGIAAYEGYKFAFRVFTQEDLAELNNNAN